MGRFLFKPGTSGSAKGDVVLAEQFTGSLEQSASLATKYQGVLLREGDRLVLVLDSYSDGGPKVVNPGDWTVAMAATPAIVSVIDPEKFELFLQLA